MSVIRYTCPEWDSHDTVIVSVPDSMKHALKAQITVPCPGCDRGMEGQFL